MSDTVCNDFGLSAIAAHLGKTSALETYYEGALKESSGDVEGAITLYRRAYRLWPALDSITIGGIPSSVRDEAVAAKFTCPGMIDIISLPLARASAVMYAPGLLSMQDLTDIETIRREIALLETPLENNAQNATHMFKINTMLNNPPSYMFSNNASHIVSKILQFAAHAWDEGKWGEAGGPLEEITGGVSALSIRMIEHWEYSTGSGLHDPVHYDMNSVLTIVALLSPESAFEGGVFQTNESNGEMMVHSLQQRDIICFVSHKYHNITPITKGIRKTLVMELWQGGIGHFGRGD